MLTLDEIYKRLQCCYTELLKKQTDNISKLIFDEELDYKVLRAYELLKIKEYIQDCDYKRYVHDINQVCSENLNCGCFNCQEEFEWIGIDPVCEEGGSTTTTSSTSTTTFITSSSTSSTTSGGGIDVGVPPAWLIGIASSTNPNNREFSFYTQTTQTVQVKIDTLDSSNISGKDYNGNTWIQGEWKNQGVGDIYTVAPYNQVFRWNGLTLGTGGLVPGQTYKFSIRRENDNSVRYVRNITVPMVAQGVTPIIISGNSTTSSTTTTTPIINTSTTSSTSTTTSGGTNTTTSSTSTTSNSGGGTVLPGLGAYGTVHSDCSYTYTKHRDITLSFLPDQRITDITSGLVWNGTNTVVNGQNRFYIIDSIIFQDASGNNLPLQNIRLRKGIHTVEAYDCNPAFVPNFAVFKYEKTNGWNQQVVAGKAKMQFIFLSIHSNETSFSDVPDWIKVSAKLEIPLIPDGKNFGNKRIAIAAANAGTTAAQYHALDYITDYNFALAGPNTATTIQAHGIPSDGFYDAGRSRINSMGNSTNILLTSQFAEDSAPEKDPAFFQGAVAQYNSVGVTNVRDMGIYGEYGLFGPGQDPGLLKDYTKYVESLTTKLYLNYSPGGVGWTDNSVNAYYSSGRINWQNGNAMSYFGVGPWNVWLEFLYQNEITKVRTKTYQGQDRERNLVGFTMVYYQDYSGVSPNDVIIKFPNGDIRHDDQFHPVDWNLMYRYTFITGLVAEFNNWDTPGKTLGLDPNTLSTNTVFLPGMQWRPTGDSNWQPYNPGVNGAPLLASNGIESTMSGIASNASFAAGEKLKSIITKCNTKLELISYNSTLGNFVANGGDTGLHLNGWGPLNLNNFDVGRLYGKGVLIKGTGTTGTVLVYCNEFISPDRSEVVSAEGKTWTAFGGQVYIIPLTSTI